MRKGQWPCTGVQAEAACEAWSPGSLPEPGLVATVPTCPVSDLQLRVTESAPSVSSLTPHPRPCGEGAFTGPVLQMGTQRPRRERTLKGPDRLGRLWWQAEAGTAAPGKPRASSPQASPAAPCKAANRQQCSGPVVGTKGVGSGPCASSFA